MINANELRCDNLILRKGIRHEDLNFYEIKVTPNDIQACALNNKHFKGIPLTEDWLIRFNIFKADGYPHKLLVGYLKLRNGFYFFKYYDLEIELKYVHQLQNLYFSLTGQELEVSK